MIRACSLTVWRRLTRSSSQQTVLQVVETIGLWSLLHYCTLPLPVFKIQISKLWHHDFFRQNSNRNVIIIKRSLSSIPNHTTKKKENRWLLEDVILMLKPKSPFVYFMSGSVCPFTSTNCLLYLQRIDLLLAELTPASQCRLGLMRWRCVVFKGRLQNRNVSSESFNSSSDLWTQLIGMIMCSCWQQQQQQKQSNIISECPNHNANSLLHQSQTLPWSGPTTERFHCTLLMSFRRRGGAAVVVTDRVTREKCSCHVLSLTVKANIFCVCPVRFLI